MYLLCLNKIVNSVDKKCNVSLCTKPVHFVITILKFAKRSLFVRLCNNDFENENRETFSTFHTSV